MHTIVRKLTNAALVGTGLVASYFIGERRARVVNPDPSNAAIFEAISVLQQRLSRDNFMADVSKIVQETATFVASSQLSSFKLILITGTVISFTIGAAVVLVAPKITLALMSFRSKKTASDPKPPSNSEPVIKSDPVLHPDQDHNRAALVSTPEIPNGIVAQNPVQHLNVVFHVAYAQILVNEIEHLRQRVASRFPAVNIVTLEANNTRQLTDMAPQLIFRFDIVDDRIRELDKKADESSSLFALTNDNCVWVFVCHKPTDSSDSASIKNSLKNSLGFKSGYTNKFGEHVNHWLKFDYKINSAVKDAQGNMQHSLVHPDLIQRDIEAIIAARI